MACGSRAVDKRRPASEQGKNAPLWRVLRAVSKGARTVERIALKSSLSVSATRTCLKRLGDQGWIFTTKAASKRRGHRGGVKGDVLKHYHYHAEVECLLLDIWKQEPDGKRPDGWPFPRAQEKPPRVCSPSLRAA